MKGVVSSRVKIDEEFHEAFISEKHINSFFLTIYPKWADFEAWNLLLQRNWFNLVVSNAYEADPFKIQIMSILKSYIKLNLRPYLAFIEPCPLEVASFFWIFEV